MSSKIRISRLSKNHTKDGKPCLKGSLSPVASFLIMLNDFKKGDRDPDYFLYLTQNERQNAGRKGFTEPAEKSF